MDMHRGDVKKKFTKAHKNDEKGVRFFTDGSFAVVFHKRFGYCDTACVKYSPTGCKTNANFLLLLGV